MIKVCAATLGILMTSNVGTGSHAALRYCELSQSLQTNADQETVWGQNRECPIGAEGAALRR
jgi:hypothetical protein